MIAKATYACAKCGRLLLTYDIEPDAMMVDVRTGQQVGGVVAQLTCPVCVMLTHGPLTEAMVALALEESTDPGRLVIRLLNEREHRWSDKWKMSEQPVMDWLLKLAREP